MYEAYRVRQSFRWRGWHYGPQHVTRSIDPHTGQFGACNCAEYAGDIWIVEAGHPRKEAMLMSRTVVWDASIPPVEELLKEECCSRLLSEPKGAPLYISTRGRPPKVAATA